MIKSKRARLTRPSILSEAHLEKVYFTFIPKKQMHFCCSDVFASFALFSHSEIISAQHFSLFKEVANKNIDILLKCIEFAPEADKVVW